MPYEFANACAIPSLAGLRGAIVMLGLTPYSSALQDRLTARHSLSARLVQETLDDGGRSILDVGCATGWFEYLMRSHTPAALTGIDLNPDALEEARRNAPSAHFETATALELPFAAASFDGAVMFELIEHVPRGTEPRALAEVRRVLRTGSWLWISTPYAHPVAAALDPAWYVGHRHYRTHQLEAMVQAAGFRVDHSFTRGGAWEIGGMFALYACKWILKSEVPGRASIERGREREFLDGRAGFTHLFLKATAA